MSLERFEIISKLNNSLNDLLILARNKEDGQLYTIKSVRVNENNKKEKDLFFNELKILVPLTHKNIVSYKEAFYDKRTKSLNLVIEYVDGGDLSMKIKAAKQKNVFFKEIIIWEIFIQILEGINYLHKKFIIHKDLKTSNIFLTKNGIVKIGGLNVGKNIEDLGLALTQIGTPYFTSPEIWAQKPYDYKCDIWSIGCILYEMTTLHVPFLGLNIQELYKNILSAKYKSIPKIYSKNLNEIIDLMLIKDPLKRPSADDLLNNKIILEKKKELNKLNYYKKITKSKINENRNVNIKNNNRNEIIISKRNPKSLSNIMKYNININSYRENYISGINNRNQLNNSTNLKKNRSNMNNFILLKRNNNQNINNNINNKNIRNINIKRKKNLRISSSPNKIRNFNSFVGNNKKIDMSNLFLHKPKLRIMNNNCLSENNSNITNNYANSNDKYKQDLNYKKYLIIPDNNNNKIINIQKNNINYNYFTYNSYIKEKKERNREIKNLNGNIIKKK